MKIGFIIYGTLDTLSGGYLYDRMFVRELQRHGARVEILSLPWRHYPAHLADNLNWRFRARAAAGAYDILLQDELNHPSLFLFNRWWRAAVRVPIISIVHHLRSHEQHPALSMPLYRAIERQYLRSVDGFLVNSWTTRRAVESFLSEPRPFHVAYPAGDHLQPPAAAYVAHRIDADYTRAEAIQSKGAGRESAADLHIAFVGNITPRKELHTLVAALALLPPALRVRIHVHIVGDLQTDPAYVAAVKRSIQHTNAADVVTFYGRVEAQKLRTILDRCQALAVPSFEGFGIVYLEAMAYGLCPIASTAGAAQEIVRHGVNGLLVPPSTPTALAEQFMSLLQNPRLLRNIRSQARAAYERHPSWQRTFGSVYLWLHEST